MEYSQPTVDEYKAHSFMFVNPIVITEHIIHGLVQLSVSYDINFKSEFTNGLRQGSVKIYTVVDDLRYYDGRESLDLLIQDRLGFSLSELVYWVISPDFDISVKRDKKGKIKNPDGYKLSNVTKQVGIRDITKTPNVDGLTTDVEGYITLLDQGAPIFFGFTISVTNTSGNKTEN